MEKFILEFDLENDHFKPCTSDGIVEILNDISKMVYHGRYSGNVYDSNGNVIGEYNIKGE